MNEASDIVVFFGRFHPLIVHLPIGFLVLAAIMELLSTFYKKKFEGLSIAISISILCGGFGALASAIIGYMLSQQGGYEDQTLFWHQWLGILLSILSFLGWAIKSGRLSVPYISSKVIIIALIILISITGHLGGNLTHGSDYLTVYAPEFLGGNKKGSSGLEISSNPDSVSVFKHLIQPILNTKCISCHNDTKSNGGLLLTTKEGIINGGDNGMVLNPNQPYQSELFLRCTFPKNSKKFMPPKGNALTFSELKLLEFWISEGASFDANVSSYTIPDHLIKIFLRDFKLNTKKLSYYETVIASKLSKEVLLEFSQKGWLINTLSADHHMLDIKLFDQKANEDQLKTLLKGKLQITWLDISDESVTDNLMKSLSELENLTRLNLSNTNISDKGVTFLNTLKHLEVLNLYGTKITDESITVFKNMPSLKRLYLWQTEVTQVAIEELKEQNKEIEIIGVTKSKS